jgi:hypothetical protein
MAVMSSDRLEGGADAGPYGAQELAERRSFPTRLTGWSRCHRVRRAPARAGTVATPLQWRGWQSTGLPPPPNPVGSQESTSMVRRPPFRGLGTLAVPGRARGVTGLTPAVLHRTLPQWRGWAPPWGVGAAALGCEPRAHDGAVLRRQGVKCPCTEPAHACGAPASVAGPSRGRGVPSSEAKPARGKCCPSSGVMPVRRERAANEAESVSRGSLRGPPRWAVGVPVGRVLHG